MNNQDARGFDTPTAKAAGFLLHRERPAVTGLKLAPQAFSLSVCPTASWMLIPTSLIFFAASCSAVGSILKR